jgi:hypothetical protein
MIFVSQLLKLTRKIVISETFVSTHKIWGEICENAVDGCLNCKLLKELFILIIASDVRNGEWFPSHKAGHCYLKFENS